MKKELLTKFMIIGIASIILISIPIIFFVNHFFGSEISDDIAEWGSFGDFFGGIINTVLSLSSLILLGYLTLVINNQSLEENKKLNFLTRRLDAYEKLTSYLPELGRIFLELSTYFNSLSRNLRLEGVSKDVIREFGKNTKAVLEFYTFMTMFNARYGHLFEYDFNCDDYKNFSKNVFTMKEFFTNAIVALESLESENFPTFEFKIFEELNKNMDLVLRELIKELK
nr:hypothetical protein [Flavobacterium sp. ASV13]